MSLTEGIIRFQTDRYTVLMMYWRRMGITFMLLKKYSKCTVITLKFCQES